MGVPPMQNLPAGKMSPLRQNQHGLEARGTHGRDAHATANAGETPAPRFSPATPAELASNAARVRVSVRYWRLAVVFVLFDLGGAFLVAWAIAVRELGWPGYAGVCAFAAGLGLALAYVWRQGVLDWGTDERSADS